MHEETGLWMVPYADLMSTLLLLFLALYAQRVTHKNESAVMAAKIASEMAGPAEAALAAERLEEANLAVKIQERLKGLALADFGVNVDSRYVRLTLPAPVLFKEGSASLSPEAKPVLTALASLLGSVDNPILVEGHTDDVPIAGGYFTTNWELSAARALSVVRFFVEQAAMPRERFAIRGYSQYRPTTPNSDSVGRRKNRRIEISLLRERLKKSGVVHQDLPAKIGG